MSEANGAYSRCTGSAFPPVLDACCGSRMFWFDRKDSRAVFVDKRQERHTLPDVSSAGGARELVIDPDHVADFTALPFPSDTFALVVFDPPQFERNGARSWVGLKYGTLAGDWTEMLRAGFAECFRVLRPEGTLIFKWCADEIPVSRILALTPERPLFGHKSGKNSKTHWIAFLKPNAPDQEWLQPSPEAGCSAVCDCGNHVESGADACRECLLSFDTQNTPMKGAENNHE